MKKPEERRLKRCFFIAPIDAKDSEIRKRSDRVLNAIVRPVATMCGYEVIRADEIHNAGSINTQVVERIIDDEMVIADLTGHNPNVFYELALRHAIGKPCVQMIEAGQRVPFDLYDYRTIEIEGFEIECVEKCRTELEKHILSSENFENIETPLTRVVRLKNMQASSNYTERSMAEINEALNSITTNISAINGNIRNLRPYPVKQSSKLNLNYFANEEFTNLLLSMGEAISLSGNAFSSDKQVVLPNFRSVHSKQQSDNFYKLVARSSDRIWHIAIVDSLFRRGTEDEPLEPEETVDNIIDNLLQPSEWDGDTSDQLEFTSWIVFLCGITSDIRKRVTDAGILCSSRAGWLNIQRRIILTFDET